MIFHIGQVQCKQQCVSRQREKHHQVVLDVLLILSGCHPELVDGSQGPEDGVTDHLGQEAAHQRHFLLVCY